MIENVPANVPAFFGADVVADNLLVHTITRSFFKIALPILDAKPFKLNNVLSICPVSPF